MLRYLACDDMEMPDPPVSAPRLLCGYYHSLVGTSSNKSFELDVLWWPGCKMANLNASGQLKCKNLQIQQQRRTFL